MSLSEKTETLPPASEPVGAVPDTGAGAASAQHSKATVIERWDALEGGKVAPEVRAPRKRPPASPKPKVTSRAKNKAAASSHGGPAARPNSGYSTVNYHIDTGKGSSGKRRSSSQKDLPSTQAGAGDPETRQPPANRPSGQQHSGARGAAPQAGPTGSISKPEPPRSDANPRGEGNDDLKGNSEPLAPPVSPPPTSPESGSKDAVEAPEMPSSDRMMASEAPLATTPAPTENNKKDPAQHSDNKKESTGEKTSDSGNSGELSVQDKQAGKLRAESAGVASSRPSTPPPLPPETDGLEQAHYGRSIFVGMLLLILGIGGFLAWASFAPISSGVVASGVVKLQGERKTVQHLEGGIIKELLVREGDAVKEGQVLIRLDGSRAEAILDVQSTEYLELLAKKNRLQSERLNLDSIEFDQALLDRSDDPDIAELMESERSLLADRNANHEYQLKIFSSWTEGYQREITGLQAQKTASEQQLIHINDELDSVESLYKKGVVAKTRLLELKRTAAGLKGQSGALTANIARAEQKIGEADLRGVSLQNERAEEISSQLTEVDNQIRRLKEQLPAQRDVVDRLEIRAPRSGRVVNLRFYTAGGVISPSTPILDIVPEDDQLLVEARVKPVDIDILRPGMEARITLTAYSARKTPPVPGKLQQVSADRVSDPNTGEAYYRALVTIDPDALAALSEVALYPGMPASVQFVGGERTPMDYLLSPLQAGLRKGWLEE